MNDELLNTLANRFCAAVLPTTVCSDPCASMSDYAFPRSGTNLLTVAEAKEVLRQVLPTSPGEADYQAFNKGGPDCQPDGTVEALETCATMLETWGPECFPANDQGQVHFARSMMDSTALEIRAFLRNRDSDGSGEAGETVGLDPKGDSAGRDSGIVQPQPPSGVTP